ncbi:MAG: DUF2786 domain-containing protein [Deltaproteobacteria bacterium]|jgi:hypothetical protein|nr:DUF2786 domain-containing protein [Deltaproteobacteria bacterium]
MVAKNPRRSVEERLKTNVLKKLRDYWFKITGFLRDVDTSELKPPSIDIEPLKGVWGCWLPENRLILLSENLVLKGSWDSIVGVFSHEVVHQLVSELFQGLAEETRKDSPGAHGVAFQRVYESMFLDPYYSGPSVDLDLGGGEIPTPFGKRKNEANAHPVLAKVKKLLALASGGESFESAAALAAAERLLVKHNLDESDLESRENPEFERWTLDLGPKITFEHDLICRLLSGHFFVSTIYCSDWIPIKNRKRELVELIGRPVNLAMAEYVFRFLQERCETLWKAHEPLAESQGESGRGVRESFVRYLLLGFADKLRLERELARKGAGSDETKISDKLILIGKDERKRFMEKCHPRISRSSRRAGTANAPGAVKAGWDAGKSLTIHSPVGNGGASGPRKRIGGG